jgi:GIY-YIG catalytic domain
VGDRTAEDADLPSRPTKPGRLKAPATLPFDVDGHEMIDLDRVKKAPGVYLMLDLDDKPVYAGQADNLSRRMRDHLISQKSDVVTDGLLDVYEVRSVAIWYRITEFALPLGTDDEDEEDLLAKRLSLDEMEAALIRRYQPRWNRSKPTYAGPIPSLTVDNRDDIIELVEGDELRVRKDALRRIETKLIHLLRAVRKATISGSTRQVRKALVLHACELIGCCNLLVPHRHRSVPHGDGHGKMFR